MYRILEERKNQPINGLKRIPCFRIGIALFEGFKSKELKVEFFSEGRVSEKDINKWFYVATSRRMVGTLGIPLDKSLFLRYEIEKD